MPSKKEFKVNDNLTASLDSHSIIKIIEGMNESQIKTLVEHELDDLLFRDDLVNIKQEALFLYLRTIYNVSLKLDDGIRWVKEKVGRFTYEHIANRKIVSAYIKEEVLNAIEHRNLKLIQDYLDYYDFYEFLINEDADDLFINSSLIEFLIEHIDQNDYESFFVNFFNNIFPKTLSSDLNAIIRQNVIEHLKKKSETIYETLLRANLIKYLTPEDIKALPNKTLTNLIKVSEDISWQSLEFSVKIYDEFNELISTRLVDLIIEILETKDYEEIFEIWDKGYLYKLDSEDLINLFAQHGVPLIENIFKSLHFIAYEKRKGRIEKQISIIPTGYKKTSSNYVQIDIIPKEKIKQYIKVIIKKQDFTNLVPLVAAYFLDYLGPKDIHELILDEENGFFKNVIQILGEYHFELNFYNDDFCIDHLEFFKVCKLIDKSVLKSLILSVMNDDSITNYESIIEEGLIRKFSHSELIDILELLDIKRLKAFLISLTEAVKYFEGYDGFELDKTFRYIVNIEKYLSKPLKESMVNIIKESEPEPVYFSNGRLIRKNWNLALNLGKLGWFKYLELRQLEELLTKINKKYRDKDISSWDKTDFRNIIKNMKKSIKECHEKPFEELSLTKAQLREFLNKLAGHEGCQYNGLQWRCGGKEFIYARKILNKMNIPKEEQELLLEKCREFGGYCDCEILMNAAQMLLEEDTPW